MIKKCRSLLLCFMVLKLMHISIYSCTEISDSSNPEELVLVCGDSKVLLVSKANSTDSFPQIIWSWDAHLANDLPFEYRTKKFNSMDDCKAIDQGRKIMVSSSSGGVAIINRENKKVVFYTDVPNAHSIEMLPKNKIVVASSTAEKGNKLMIFDISQPDKLLFSDSLYSAHGVVWDEKRSSLFALGYDVLRQYNIEDEVNLVLITKWKIPGIGGHDLQMAPDGNSLFISEHTGVWNFDLESNQFNKIDQFPDAENIKSIGQNRSGQFVYTLPEESWWAYHVSFFNPSGFLSFPNMRVYKARWYNTK